MCITEDKLVESYGKATPRERFRLIYNVYSDDFGQAFYFKTDNSRMKNGQPSGFRNTALCITKPARNQGFLCCGSILANRPLQLLCRSGRVFSICE